MLLKTFTFTFVQSFRDRSHKNISIIIVVVVSIVSCFKFCRLPVSQINCKIIIVCGISLNVVYFLFSFL